MSSDFIFLKGKSKWFRHQQPDPWGNWKHDLYLDKESIEKIRELQLPKNNVQGIKNVLKKDEDGYYVTLRRPQQKMMRGKVIGFAPPEILDGATTLPDGSNPPLRDVLVGNGSDIVTKVEIYSHPTPGGGRARAMRWLSSRIDNLVPFQSREELTDIEEKLTRDLADQPKQLF